ncbi:hypothetical protein QUB30_22970 [Microcoleus sp. BROC3]
MGISQGGSKLYFSGGRDAQPQLPTRFPSHLTVKLRYVWAYPNFIFTLLKNAFYSPKEMLASKVALKGRSRINQDNVC